MPNRVTLRAPATTANLGPGFDCLGMALDIFDTVTLELGEPETPADDLQGQHRALIQIGRAHV